MPKLTRSALLEVPVATAYQVVCDVVSYPQFVPACDSVTVLEQLEDGLRAKVVVRGTLNKRDDEDQGWDVELAIPWKAVRGRDAAKLRLPPQPGDRFRANLLRTDRPKKGALRAWAWSPPRKPTFHALDRFGTLVFGDAEGKTASKARPAAMRPAAMRPAAMRPAAMRPAAMRPAGGMR